MAWVSLVRSPPKCAGAYAGMLTYRSRGSEVRYAWVRVASTCITMMESDRGIQSFCVSLVSTPAIRMLSGPVMPMPGSGDGLTDGLAGWPGRLTLGTIE